MLATWTGPAIVEKRLENNNYLVKLGRRTLIRHINSLRKYYADEQETETPSCETVGVAICESDSDEFEDSEFRHRPPCGSSGGDKVIKIDARGAARRRPGDEKVVNTATVGRMTNDNHRPMSDTVGDTNDLDQVMMGDQLTDEQRDQLTELLHEYSATVFSPKLGRTDLVQHHIQLTDETPTWQSSYPVPESLRDEVECERKRKQDGLIELDTESKYNSPLICIRKPNGKLRLVNNFIKLNEKTVKDHYDMKNANEIIYRVAGASYISVIDLVKFFYQIELPPECRHYTAFYTPFGTFHYNVLAQGLCGAPNVAQKLIDRVMRGSHRHCAGLMDDLIVYSTTWENI